MSVKVTELEESTQTVSTGDDFILGYCEIYPRGRLHTVQKIVSIQNKGDFGKCIHCGTWLDMFSGEEAPFEVKKILEERGLA